MEYHYVKIILGTREMMAPQLRTLTALIDDGSSVLSTSIG